MKFSWKHDLCYYTSCHLDGPIKLMGPSIYRLPMPDPRWFLQRYLFKKNRTEIKEMQNKPIKYPAVHRSSTMNAEWHSFSSNRCCHSVSSWWFQHCKYSKVKMNIRYYKMYLKKKKKSHLLCVCDVFMCTLIHNLTSSFHIRSVWAMTSPIGFLNIPLKLFKNLTRSGAPYRNA